jgi:hypothetical protein
VDVEGWIGMRQPQRRQASLTRVGEVLLWFLWVVNALNDVLQAGRPSPFTLVMLAALLAGYMLLWLGVVPNPGPRRRMVATFAGLVIVVIVIYLLVQFLQPG